MLASALELAAMLLHQAGNVKIFVIMTTVSYFVTSYTLSCSFTWHEHTLGSPIDKELLSIINNFLIDKLLIGSFGCEPIC